MRAIIKFGGFVMYDFKIPPGAEFRDIFIIHPMGRLKFDMRIEQSPANLDIPKKMRFEYRKRLDEDLLEYVYADED